MTLDDIVNLVGSFEGTVTQRPREGDGTPELAWGDAFFYYSPDGTIPTIQPFATIVTKNYPGDELSQLDRTDAFRVNIVAGKQEFERILGVPPREAANAPQADVDDVLAAHPQYGTAGCCRWSTRLRRPKCTFGNYSTPPTALPGADTSDARADHPKNSLIDRDSPSTSNPLARSCSATVPYLRRSPGSTPTPDTR